MNVADYIAKYLAKKQVPAVFELVGGMITFLLDSLYQEGGVRLVSMHHEQGAAFAAEGAARVGGTPCVAMATSGPGATNLVTGIASCYFDSTPAVFITGQVNLSEQKGTSGVRQLGFQETDIVRMIAPVVKRAWAVTNPLEIPQILDEAFEIATSGRPGPVLIDIPMDVQRAQLPDHLWEPKQPVFTEQKPDITQVNAEKIIESLLSASRPLILAGGGIRSSQSVDLFREFVDRASIPVVHSLMAVDALRSDHPLNAGMIGSYGNRWANLAISECDCLLVLGSRLDVRQTGPDTEGFIAGRRIFHIDCDAAELNNRVKGCEVFISDLRPALKSLNEAVAPFTSAITAKIASWVSEISALRRQWPDTMELKDVSGINPNTFMHDLSRMNRDAAAYVVDVGQHQMWAAQSLDLGDSQRFLTSGGMGSMGFALPAAIGAAVVSQGAPVVMIAGDGSFQCNIQELETVAHLKLPIRMVVVNNKCHGMVRQFQQSYFASRYQSTVWGYSSPDFAAIAAAYGIPSASIRETNDIESALSWQAGECQGPSLLQVMISETANAYPKLAFGKGMAAMEPLVRSLEMEST